MLKTLKSVVLAGGLLAAVTAGAQSANAAIPGPSGTFSTGFTIQNISNPATAATCQVEFLSAAGTTAFTTAAFTVAAGGSQFTYVPSLTGLAAGQYSAVVSCDQTVAAISNHVSGLSSGSYQGTDASKLATVWYSPNAQDNYFGYFSNFVVQNATSNSVNVTIEFFAPGNSTAVTSQTATIPGRGTSTFEQAGLAALANNVVYSAKITASDNIAVEQNIYGSGSSNNQLFSFTPFTAGTINAYAPAVSRAFFGYNTALTIQNLGSAAANVTVTYGTGASENATIQPNSSHVILHQNSTVLSAGTLTSARIVSDQPIVALVNQASSRGRAASYAAFGAGATRVNMPIATKVYFNYNSAITCMNVGSAAADVTLTYSNGAASTKSAVAAGNTAFFYQPSETGLSNGFNGSAVATSTQPIVCVGNQDQDVGPNATASGDFLLAYEGIGQ